MAQTFHQSWVRPLPTHHCSPTIMWKRVTQCIAQSWSHCLQALMPTASSQVWTSRRQQQHDITSLPASVPSAWSRCRHVASWSVGNWTDKRPWSMSLLWTVLRSTDERGGDVAQSLFHAASVTSASVVQPVRLILIICVEVLLWLEIFSLLMCQALWWLCRQRICDFTLSVDTGQLSEHVDNVCALHVLLWYWYFVKEVFRCAENRDWNRRTVFHCAEHRDWKLILISWAHFPQKNRLGLCRFSAQWSQLHWNSHVCSMPISVTIFCVVKHPFYSFTWSIQGDQSGKSGNVREFNMCDPSLTHAIPECLRGE